MATARSTDPRLEIVIGVDETTSEQEQRRFLERMRLVAATEETKTQQAVSREKAKGQVQRENAELKHQQKLSQMEATEAKRREIAAERARQRELAGHTTWSQKIVANTNRIVTATRALVALQATQLVMGAIRYTTSLVDQADALGLNIDQLEAMRVGAMRAGVTIERVIQMMVNLTGAASSPTDKQAGVIAKLGLTTDNLTSVQLFDAALNGLKSGTIDLGNAIDLVGNRQAFVLSALSNNMQGVSDVTLGTGESLRKMEAASEAVEAAISRLKVLVTGFIGNLLIYSDVHTAVAHRKKELADQEEQLNAKLAQQQAYYDRLSASYSRNQESLTGGAMYGPSAMEARVALQREWAQGVIDEYLAQEKANRERERANEYLQDWLLLTGRRSLPAGAMPEREFALPTPGALPQPERTNVQPLIDGESELALKVRLANELIAEQADTFRLVSDVMSSLQGVSSALFDLWTVQAQNEIAHYERLMGLESDRWDERSSRLRAAGLESTAMYRNEARQQEQTQKAMQKNMARLQSRAWEQEKDARTVSVVMSTAQAIMNAMATVQPFFPLGMAMSVLAGAQGAIQVAAIQAQSNPYKGFASGGIIGGAGFFDNQLVNARAGEAIVSAPDTQRNARALEFINRGGTVNPGGGSVSVTFNGPILGTQDFVDSTLMPAIKRAIRNGHLN